MTPLVAVLGAPVAWMLHLLASYAVVGLACAAHWNRAGSTLVLVTAICLAAALASGGVAYRRWRAAGRAGGERDIMLVGIFGTAIFGAAILLESLVPAFVPLCPV
jgi:uncharacterized membrane protein YhaH (DUF805 family)